MTGTGHYHCVAPSHLTTAVEELTRIFVNTPMTIKHVESHGLLGNKDELDTSPDRFAATHHEGEATVSNSEQESPNGHPGALKNILDLDSRSMEVDERGWDWGC